MKFTIITPAYNSEKTIGSFVFSILKQKSVDLEMIVQDGGSTDSTLEILAGIRDPRLKVYSEQDLGIYDVTCAPSILQSAKSPWV